MKLLNDLHICEKREKIETEKKESDEKNDSKT